ncbi:MAG TPA: hypothetical protein VMB20_04145 [Candidatus Acidoferrum sp.]|nr:hypothetical protein [Candidatus Acidoferrum sp.]
MDRLEAQHVAATIEGLIFSEALKPLMRDADPLGGYGVTYFAQLLAAKLVPRD